MEATVSYLEMLQKYINSNKKTHEIKDYALCLGNISKDEKTGLKGVPKLFSVDFNPIDSNDILDIHKYFMKRTCLGYLRKYYWIIN